jgi:hypothetical protein
MAAELSNYVSLTLFQLSNRCPVPAGGGAAGPGGVRRGRVPVRRRAWVRAKADGGRGARWRAGGRLAYGSEREKRKKERAGPLNYLGLIFDS